jgi:hypothetical protein
VPYLSLSGGYNTVEHILDVGREQGSEARSSSGDTVQRCSRIRRCTPCQTLKWISRIRHSRVVPVYIQGVSQRCDDSIGDQLKFRSYFDLAGASALLTARTRMWVLVSQRENSTEPYHWSQHIEYLSRFWTPGLETDSNPSSSQWGPR